MMDDKMNAAFDAWLEKESPMVGPEDCVEWTLDYLRSQQEPVGMVTYTGYEPEHRLEWLNGNAPDRLGEGARIYAHPIPSAPTVPDGVSLIPTRRYKELIDCLEAIGNGSGGWAWEEVLEEHRAMLAAAPSPEKKES